MTKISPEFGGEVEMQAFRSLSADVSFVSNQFPKYKLGPNDQVLEEVEVNNKGPPLKEVILQETAQLTEQHKRLSVRDLASKFDKNLAAAAKLSNEVVGFSSYNLNCSLCFLNSDEIVEFTDNMCLILPVTFIVLKKIPGKTIIDLVIRCLLKKS